MNKAILLLRRQFEQRIRWRLTSYFLLILLPLVAVSLFANAKSQTVLTRKTSERTQAGLSSSMEYIDLVLRNADNVSSSVATNPHLIDLLHQIGTNPDVDSLLRFRQVAEEITDISSIHQTLDSISIIHVPSNYAVVANYGGKRLQAAEKHEAVQRTLSARGAAVLYVPDGYGDSLNGMFSADRIYFLRMMDTYNRDQQTSLLLWSIRKETFASWIKPLLPSERSQMELYPDGPIPVIEWGDKTVSPAERMIEWEAKGRYSKWSLKMAQPIRELQGETGQLRLFTYFIAGISILLALWIAWIVYHSISSPLNRLVQAMKEVQSGDLNVRIAALRQDELGFVASSFNRMVEEQQQWIQGYYEQELRLSKAELKFLQSQMNPHFLYNTLDSIYWMAHRYDAEEIKEMVLHLSSFFRLSLNKESETYSLKETIDHLHDYVRIQQIRFSGRFTVSYDIPDDAADFPVLKLLLQPLVENALLHGLESREQHGLLNISGRLEDGMLVLRVKDNGAGLTPERLNYIRAELNEISRSSSKLSMFEGRGFHDLFGLRNTLARIKLYYGPAAELGITSAVGEGTEAVLRLPLPTGEVAV